MIALGPDYDSTTLVKLCQIESAPRWGDVGPLRFVSGPQWLGSEIIAGFALDDGKMRALTRLAHRCARSDVHGRGTPLDSDPDQATVAFAITGRRDSKAVFVADGADDGRVLNLAAGRPESAGWQTVAR